MIEYWDFFAYGYEPPPGGQGMATTLPADHEDDKIERLHDVVQEITGKPVVKAPRTPIGFL